MSHARRVAVAALTVLALAGCVEQRLVIRSNPPGARAFVNGRLAGETPVTTGFDWYTNYQIHVEHPGYLSVDAREMVRSPWYMWMPLDALTEALPWRVVDERQFAYELAQAPDGVGPPSWAVEPTKPAAPGTAAAGKDSATQASPAGESTDKGQIGEHLKHRDNAAQDAAPSPAPDTASTTTGPPP